MLKAKSVLAHDFANYPRVMCIDERLEREKRESGQIRLPHTTRPHMAHRGIATDTLPPPLPRTATPASRRAHLSHRLRPRRVAREEASRGAALGFGELDADAASEHHSRRGRTWRLARVAPRKEGGGRSNGERGQ